MKKTWVIALLCFASGRSHSQSIVVAKYEPEVTINMDDLDGFLGPMTTGGCSVIQKAFLDEKASGGCAGVLIRTYSFSDACGNHATATVFIHLKDSTPPRFDPISPELTVSSQTDLPNVAVPTATDNSGTQPELHYSDKLEKDIVIRTWTATDDCGNSSEIVQKIKLR
ncbi:MAG: hypothetical protein K1X54_11080 [Flavobacteriales bacterium]|nr:hypothetical protein [Flavobacteriales bacterium]